MHEKLPFCNFYAIIFVKSQFLPIAFTQLLSLYYRIMFITVSVGDRIGDLIFNNLLIGA